MATPAAYIFDLDGTLIDSEIIWVGAMREFLEERLGAYSMQQALALVYGRSWRDIHGDVVRDHPELAMPIEHMEPLVAPFYKRMAVTRDIRIWSSIRLLQQLSRNHPVCIVSGSSRRTIGEAVTMMGIGPLLQFYLGADDYAPGKPDPTCYHMAAERLNLRPAQCLVFEDSNVGVRAAKGAGMYCVALVQPNRPPQDYSAADMILEDLAAFDPAALPPVPRG